MSLASRSPSKENGHHVTVVLLRCFLLLPYHRTSQPESPVSSVPCTTCGRRGASKEKKCGFMVCCRERPAWWGALVKVDIPFNTLRKLAVQQNGRKRGYIYGFQVGQLDKVANRASIQVDIFLPSSEYEPLPISRTEISRSFFRH